ncbi:hypothetical protein BGX29_011937 [Mortierella sp. GBA35]|nr:hypothetical protein BGX29_011937 [Mortierella sp. GBA35]
MQNVAMHAHHMSLSMGLSELSLSNSTGLSPSDMSGLSGLGQLNTSGLHGSMSALSSACSTPTTMAKVDLSGVVHSFDNNLISLAHLTQQGHYQSLTDGTTDLDDASNTLQHMYDRDQADLAAAVSAATGQYSPLMEDEYQTAQSHYQDAYNQHAYSTHDYTAYTTTEPHSAYSMAMSSLASMSALIPSRGPTGYDSQPHDYITTSSQLQQQQVDVQEHSPLLSQIQMFQKQIQQEQQRFHQQQQHLMTTAIATTPTSTAIPSNNTAAPTMTIPPTLNVSTSLSSLSTSASSSSLVSPPPSAVPSLTCSIPTPTTATSSSFHSGGTPFHHQHHSPHAHTQQHHHHHHHHLTGLLDHEAKNRLGAVGGLISGVHNL